MIARNCSIWGGGFLYQLGVLDYSGGYVIHLSSGTAGESAEWHQINRVPLEIRSDHIV